MQTVAAVYTSMNIIPSIQALFDELLPEVRLINIADSSLIQDVIAAGVDQLAIVGLDDWTGNPGGEIGQRLAELQMVGRREQAPQFGAVVVTQEGLQIASGGL